MPSETLPGQRVIIEPMKALKLQSTNEGVCDGFTSALLQFALDGKLDDFINLVEFIYKTPNLVTQIEVVIKDNNQGFFVPAVKEYKEEKEAASLSQQRQARCLTDSYDLLQIINVYQKPKKHKFKIWDTF